MFLILGLGNPGPKYELTRHNAGFMVVDNFAEKHGIAMKDRGYKCHYGHGEIGGLRVVVAKPATYMNESGMAMKAIVSAMKIPPQRSIVVHDDIDLALGKIRIRHKGSDGGQRGIRSIIQRLGTEQFSRVRIGIGRPQDREDVVDYVLSPFLEDEWPEFNAAVENALNAIETVLIELNQKKNQPEDESE